MISLVQKFLICLGLIVPAFWIGQILGQRAEAQQSPAELAYRVQPGDVLKVQVLSLPDLTAEVKVRPDGKISVMLLDDVQAAGRTITEIREELTQGYAQKYRDPKVAVFPVEFNSRTIYVSGEVNKPGSVALSSGLTAMRAVIEAGGLRTNSKSDEAVLLRNSGSAQRTVIPLHLDAVLKGSANDTPLRPNDIVYIPKSDIQVYVGGEVQKAGMYPLDGELTAYRAVSLAGGLLETANPNKAVIIRNREGQAPDILDARLGRVPKGGQDIVLRPFDIVFVPKSGIAKIDKVMDLFVRRLVPLTMTGGFSYVLGGFGAAGAINCFQ